MSSCNHYGCDGRRYPVAEYRSRKTGEVVLIRPLIDEADEVLCDKENVEGLTVHVALMPCAECAPALAELPVENCVDCPEVDTPPREDEHEHDDTTSVSPWWNA